MSLLNKAKQRKEKRDPLIKLMTQMIAGMLACTFCLVSMTWAWFSASVDITMQTIKSATRSTEVIVYKLGNTDPNERTPVIPQTTQSISLADTQTTPETEATVEVSGRAVSWDLEPENSYEIVMRGSGDATKGYCEVALTHTKSGETKPTTTTYKTVAFENNHTVKLTYKTGGFESVEGVTNSQWTEYVENTTTPTLTITSYWGQPAEENEPQVALMSLGENSEETIMLLDDGAVLGLDPIPCPEAKAESKVELEGFEIQEGAIISAEEDYKMSLTLKEGYQMPDVVTVNIDGKDYIVSTLDANKTNDAPYYDTVTGVLTVPLALLTDGSIVSVKAKATLIPEEEPTEEPTEEITEETAEETTDDNDAEEEVPVDSAVDNIIADDPNKDDDGFRGHIIVGGGSDDDDDNDNDNDNDNNSSDNSEDSSDENNDDNGDNSDNTTGDNNPSDDNIEEEIEEKVDVTLNLSQLSINLEKTNIPANANLVMTISPKEEMELPEQFVVTLDKTIREENADEEGFETLDINEEEIEEDLTEYIINTDGEENLEGIEFDVETGELTISSELLDGVRAITIADIEQTEDDEDNVEIGEEVIEPLAFDIKNLRFNFTGEEITVDEDVVISFAAGEGYELPETIIITIDGKEYVIYTTEEGSENNHEGITFDIETGTLTISKELLEDSESITITAEVVKKEEDEENPDSDGDGDGTEGGSDDPNDVDKKEPEEGNEGTDKEPESGTDSSDAEDKTEPEGGADSSDTEDKTESESGTNSSEVEDKTESEGGTDSSDAEDKSETEDGTDVPSGENTEIINPDNITEDNNNETEESTPDTENSDNSETPTPTESVTPSDSSDPIATPETSKTEITDEHTSGENDNIQSDSSSESTTATAPINSTPAPSTSSDLNEANQILVTTTSLERKETSFEE